jgi:hypothetical protein
MKKYSTSLTIKEMQLKTTLRFHLTPVNMAINYKTTNAGKDVEKKKHFYTVKWECKLVQVLWKAI